MSNDRTSTNIRRPKVPTRHALALGIALALGAPGAYAGTYTVTGTLDDGSAGTLRWAIEQANADPGSTVNIQPGVGTITLSAMLPLLTADMTIEGNGNTVSGANNHRVFFAEQGTIILSDLVIANGKAQGGNGRGGGGGGAGLGGGLFVDQADVTLSEVQFLANSAFGGSGGSGTPGGDGVGGGGGGGMGGAGGIGGGPSHIGFGAGGGGGGLGPDNGSNGGSGGTSGGSGGGSAGGTGGAGGNGVGADGGFSGGGGGGGGSNSGSGFVGGSGGGGGFGGGGGGGGNDFGVGGAGGFGGGGGSGGFRGNGGAGGFGGGGGGNGGSSFGNSSSGGAGGFGGGNGGGTGQSGYNDGGGGGGGLGAGGAVFVNTAAGGTLAWRDSSQSGGSVAGGLGGAGLNGGSNGTDGAAAGSALFLRGGTLQLTVSNGIQTIAGDIADAAGEGNAASLGKDGAGTLVLAADNTYSGGTLVSAGTLSAGSDTALGDGDVAVAAGATLEVQAGVTLDNGVDLQGGTLSGLGTLIADLVFADGSTLSPGNSPGVLAAVDAAFGGGGRYAVEVADFSAGAGVGWDLFDPSGELSITASEADPFLIDLISLDALDAPGLAAGFDATQDYSLLIAEADGGISGFDITRFDLDTTAFWNDLDGGAWTVATRNDGLFLDFTAHDASVPTTGTLALMALGAFGLLRRRRSATARA